MLAMNDLLLGAFSSFGGRGRAVLLIALGFDELLLLVLYFLPSVEKLNFG